MKRNRIAVVGGTKRSLIATTGRHEATSRKVFGYEEADYECRFCSVDRFALGCAVRIYRGGDGRYYCRRSDGTTGLVVGVIAGGLLGNAIGGNALSTILGAGGGAAIGHAIDSGNDRCR